MASVSHDDSTGGDTEELSPEEMEAEAAAELPDPEVVTLVDASMGFPASTGTPPTAIPDGSAATADHPTEGEDDRGA
jgi:hypothetical protein